MPVTPETVELARQRYAEDASIKDILRETGLGAGTLYRCLDGCPDKKGEPRLAPLPRRRDVKGKRRRALAGNRSSLVARLWRTAERQVRDVEERLRRAEVAPGERERDARLMAILVKTVRELAVIDEMRAQPGADAERGGEDEDISLDDYRRELAERIDAIIAGRGSKPDGGTSGPHGS